MGSFLLVAVGTVAVLAILGETSMFEGVLGTRDKIPARKGESTLDQVDEETGLAGRRNELTGSLLRRGFVIADEDESPDLNEQTSAEELAEFVGAGGRVGVHKLNLRDAHGPSGASALIERMRGTGHTVTTGMWVAERSNGDAAIFGANRGVMPTGAYLLGPGVLTWDRGRDAAISALAYWEAVHWVWQTDPSVDLWSAGAGGFRRDLYQRGQTIAKNLGSRWQSTRLTPIEIETLYDAMNQSRRRREGVAEEELEA